LKLPIHAHFGGVWGYDGFLPELGTRARGKKTRVLGYQTVEKVLR